MSIGSESLNLWLEDLHGDQVGLKLRVRECLAAATSPFQRIAVYDSVAFGRVLTLGGAIAVTDLDEAVYSEWLAHPALQAAPKAKRVLILGGGDGGVAREVLRYPGVERVTVVEIDQQVVDACMKWFPTAAKSLQDPRVELVIDDAHRYLRACSQTFDVIIVDACELVNPASDAFHNLSFAQSVFRVLAKDAVIIAPLGCPMFAADGCRDNLHKLVERFPKPQIYQISLPSVPSGQLAVAWCSTSQQPRIGAGTEPWVAALKSWHPDAQAGAFALPRHVRQQLGV